METLTDADRILNDRILHLLRSCRCRIDTEMESPECTPARSICSMIPGMYTCSPSQIASTSISLPTIYLSTRDRGIMADFLHRRCHVDTLSRHRCARFPSHGLPVHSMGAPVPDIRYDLRSPRLPQPSTAVSPMRLRNIQLMQHFFKFMAVLGTVDIFQRGTQRSSPRVQPAYRLRLIAVCPPNCTTTPNGCSRSMTCITSSIVSGSKYSLSEME